jgi:glycerol kinase
MNSNSFLKSNQQVLVLDASPTAVKAFVVDESGEAVASAFRALDSYTPMPDWVEQDPVGLIDAARDVLREAYERRTGDVIAMGLAADREGVLAWSRQDHQALYPIITWPDKRAHDQSRDMARTVANNALVRQKTGLAIDSSLAALKLRWLTNHAETLGNCMGTLDSWLLYNLANSRPFLTDRTIAAHTGLFNIQTLAWDSELFKLFGLHEDALPEVKPSFSDFGTLRADVVGDELPIRVVMGDQQASLYATGTGVGTIEVSYGTRMSAMKIVGSKLTFVDDTATTLAVGVNDERLCALEDTIGPAAARVQPVLGQPDKLQQVLEQLGVEVAASLQFMLTPEDKRIVIDGGVSQAEKLAEIQSRLLGGIEVVRAKSHEATAVGVAKLTFDRIAQSSLS